MLSGGVVRVGIGRHVPVSGVIAENVLHVQSLLLSKVEDDVNTPFLSKLVPLLASLFIALTFTPWLQLVCRDT